MSFVVDDPEPMLWGGELVLRDGVPAGQVTSAAWGETVGATVGLALAGRPEPEAVDRAWVMAGSYQVDVAGDRVPVSVTTRPVLDPEGRRLRP